MKLRILMLGTVAALGSVTAANAAITTPTGWYLSLGAGMNWIPDGDINEIQTGVPETGQPNNFSWDSGFVASGAVGYDLGHWRVEFEVGYRQNDSDGFCTTGSCFVGSTDVWELSQMVNVLYDIGLGGNWEASVGAGIGGNLVVINPQSVFDSSGSSLSADDYVFAGQLMAEVGYRFAERWEAYLGYRYMFMGDPEFQDPGDAFEVWEMEKSDHSLLIGIRMDLQGEGMAPPPPPPPAAPMERPKEFIVFFGFNKANLTAEAARVVADAAAAAQETGAPILVVGHTDTSGSQAYNLRLSLRRADAVKGGLVQNGVPADVITVSGKGEDEPMVQTGDGVKEPQNRRAVIILRIQTN